MVPVGAAPVLAAGRIIVRPSSSGNSSLNMLIPLPFLRQRGRNEMMSPLPAFSPRARESMDTNSEALYQKGHDSSSMSAGAATFPPADTATGVLAPPPLLLFSPDGTNRILSTLTSSELPFL